MAEQMSRPVESGETSGGGYHKSAAEVAEAAEWISARVPTRPRMGVVLGSGLGGFADRLENPIAIPYDEIPNMPRTSVPGHAGKFCFGGISGIPVACLQGRVHLYEGYDAGRVAFGCRLLAALDCRAVLLTNAAGGIRLDLKPGNLMLVRDHLNLTGSNPLVGFADSFVDLTCCYDATLCEAVHRAALDARVSLCEGVYAGLMGPSYETPAEIRMLRTLGADAVGMSTVLEAIALRHAGVRVGALSCITNQAAGVSSSALDHSEVRAAASRIEESLVSLLRRWIEIAEGNMKGRNK